MDDTAGVVVEFKEPEAFAVLFAVGMAARQADAPGFGEVVNRVRPGVFVGARQWNADALVAGLRVWRARSSWRAAVPVDGGRPLTGPSAQGVGRWSACGGLLAGARATRDARTAHNGYYVQFV